MNLNQQAEFIHRPIYPGDTIAAIATAPGEGGISIIRISGNEAIAVASRIFSGPVSTYLSHTAHLGVVSDLSGLRLDEALLLLMRRPKSYTGEDTVELQCHGGLIASRKILHACIEAGARLAHPGEFTFKAFLNGKLDLTQAEAVQKLISAKNEQAFEAAGRHLEGGLSKKIRSFQSELIRIAAIVEAWVDFPEEGIEFATPQEIVRGLREIKKGMEQLYSTFNDGKKIEQGISLCIAGPPNAGKSSLMNALLDQERAIVTPLAGTTRDLLHEELTIGGLHFKLTDTAGIRECDELIEQEGVRRSKMAIEGADIILLVLDGAQAIGPQERELFTLMPVEKTLLLWNKCDLKGYVQSQTPFAHELSISAKEKIGLEIVKQKIEKLIWEKGPPPRDEILITTARHRAALSKALIYLNQVIVALEAELSPEFLAVDIRSVLVELGTILGSNITEEILSSIFSQFCIGK